jgi:fimbrial chaperone protein
MSRTFPLPLAILSIALASLPSPSARAASLTVEPISIEVLQPSAVGAVTLRNGEARPLNAQIRVFRWTQVDGEDRLEPADDVVASPPIVTISAGADYIVRLQRTAPGAVDGEDAYRTVIDELPNPNRQRNGSIAIVLRYLVPTFFLSPDATQPKLKWSIVAHGRAAVLTADNSGDKRIQIVDLKLATAAGRSVLVGKGLAGYVLGHSSRAWQLPVWTGPVSGALVVAASDHGPIRAPLSR